MSPVVLELSRSCRSAPEKVWDAITDTERVTRALGLRHVAFRPLRDASAARFLATTELYGFKVEYEERPFEWIYPRSFRIVRRMRSGPITEIELAYALAPEGDATRVTLRISLVPRYAVLAPWVRLMGGRVRRSFEQVIQELEATLETGEGKVSPTERTQVFHDAFRRAESALRAVERDALPLADRLLAFVRDGDDLDVSRIRPFALADDWGADRRELLGVCLAAVRAGLLDLRWEIVCPSCRTATDTLPSLAELTEHGACQFCDLTFGLDLEEAVEATFAPAAAVRAVDVGPYCSGGPARTPHVLVQTVLPAHGEASLPCPSELGRYRLFVRGGAVAMIDVTDGAPKERRFEGDASGQVLAIAPAGAVVVVNDGDDELHAKLERIVWKDQAAHARVVTAMPGFRRDFSTDILRPGMALKVARVGLLFSDLTGSTQLYTTAGDAAAFKLVHDHFDVVIGILERHQGTLVKTMGDAVMGVFADDLEGVAAAMDILHAFEDFRRNGEHRERTHIKLGVFGGACYVVTANGVLDYFGQTVNIAARLQAQANSGELVVEETLAARAAAAKVLPEAFVVERYDARLKGVPEPVRVARIRLPEAREPDEVRTSEPTVTAP